MCGRSSGPQRRSFYFERTNKAPQLSNAAIIRAFSIAGQDLVQEARRENLPVGTDSEGGRRNVCCKAIAGGGSGTSASNHSTHFGSSDLPNFY